MKLGLEQTCKILSGFKRSILLIVNVHGDNKGFLFSALLSSPPPRGFPADSGECQPCAPPCFTCQDKDSHCLSCQQGYLMLHHACSATCPQGYYAKEGECHRCPAHCKDCNQDGMCASECETGERWDFSKEFHVNGGKN